MKKAFDWAIEHDEEGALSMVPYLPGVPEHYASEYGYDKLKCAIASGLPASVLFVDKKTDIFMKNSDLAPIEILSMQDANYVLHILYAGLGIGTKEYNKAILRDLYNGNLLNTARIFIINNVISLDGCGEYCGNILTRALCDGKLEWVDMLLESGFSKYSASGLTAELWNGVSAANYLITEKNFKEVEDYLEYIGKIACLMEESAWNIRNWEATQDIVYGDKAIPKSFIQSLGEEIAYSHAKTQNGFAEKCLYTIHQALELRWEENFANQIMNKLNAETHNYHLFLDAPDKLLQEVSIASLAVVEKNPKTIEDYAEYLGKLAYILDKDIWDTLGWEVVQHPQYPGSLTAPSFIQALINRIVISDKKMNEEFAHKCLSAIYEALELRWGRNFANEKMNEFWQAIELSWKMGFANETDILTEQAGEMFEAAAVAQDENASHGDKFWHNIGDISMEDLLMGNSAISVAC